MIHPFVEEKGIVQHRMCALVRLDIIRHNANCSTVMASCTMIPKCAIRREFAWLPIHVSCARALE